MSSRASPTSSQTVAVHSQEPGELYRSPQVVAGNEFEAGRPYPTTTEKSDLPESSREASEWLRRSLCSEGAGQEECGTEEHGPDEEPTGRVRRKPAHEKWSTRRGRRATALLHRLTINVLRASLFCLKKSAAPGVDG